ncbi:MAG: ASKHA domain-containing protein [Deltaproteobacteria bacterium]|jgi:uncharacterized 2Fe-2S/4Fe-4S cluster protein (DUF4445 family)|nr:ASKHA domain-containing protein [Deltaproteobacteria bacterium]
MEDEKELSEITFLPDRVTVKAPRGETVLDAANRGGLHINASCGGEGVCGRCMVELRGGAVEASPGLYLSEEDFGKGLRLACRAKVSGPAEIFIPLESRGDASFFKKAAQADEKLTVDELAPSIREACLLLQPPSHDDNVSDLDRLSGALSEQGMNDLYMDLATLRSMPETLRAADFKVKVTVNYDPLITERESKPFGRVVCVNPWDDDDSHYALAVDIGTTSVWARLVNLATGEPLPSVADLNGQISYGEDVISRIVYAARPEGLKRLQRQVTDTLNKLLDRLEEQVPGYRRRTYIVYAAGNTTMSHLIAGVDPKNIRLAPYVPPAASWPSLRAAQLGINLEPHTLLKLFPSVSSYVGGDIVSGVLASGFYEREELTLYIDVGTNGEIVIGNRDWLTCAACSAGPAFEGGGVKFGMRAAPGAIENFLYDRKLKRHYLGVIGNSPPSGICGSGLINVAAELFRAGVVNKQGRFDPDSSSLVREGEDGLEYLLSPAADSAGGKDVVLTEIDVDNLIRAKGAMFSGYQTLVEAVGLDMGDLERVIIAGGFGKSLNIENAITIGLLPSLPVERFRYIGNGSLSGCTLAALSVPMWLTANDIKRKMTNFELSETPGYMDKYVASQFIPHTDSSLFPPPAQREEALGEG